MLSLHSEHHICHITDNKDHQGDDEEEYQYGAEEESLSFSNGEHIRRFAALLRLLFVMVHDWGGASVLG